MLEELRGHDAILLGAVGDPGVPSGVLERGLLLRLRFELDHHVNLRPVKLFPGVASPLAGVGPADIDFVVVREGTEGAYAGAGGFLRKGTPHEVATEESVNTAYGVERVVRDAFARAANRPRRKLTLVHKNNVLVHAGDLWTRTVKAVSADFPDIAVDYCHVDAATIFFVTDPQRFDVIVTDNLFGDILTDLGAAIAGGIGLAASGNIDPARTTPSMFEPVHGGAPTSPARRWPTRPQPCCRSPCCSTTSDSPKRRHRRSSGRCRPGRRRGRSSTGAGPPRDPRGRRRTGCPRRRLTRRPSTKPSGAHASTNRETPADRRPAPCSLRPNLVNHRGQPGHPAPVG